MRIAFIGLGTMGWPMAGHLAARHDVIVHNRSTGTAAAWAAEHGGRIAADPANAARGADVVMLCVANDAATQAVALGPSGVLDAMDQGAVLIDHGSGAADVARSLSAEADRRGLHYLDAPVTGGRVGAEQARLAVLVGGKQDVLARVRPALDCFAVDVRLMGDVGAGHLTKMVNVIIGHGNGVAMAEALGFAISAGLDPASVVEILMQGSSRSWQLEHRAGPMLAGDYTTRYPVAFARKDLGNVLAEARRAGAPLPISAMADQIYAVMEQRGFAGQDAASVIEYFVSRQNSVRDGAGRP